ncbi:MAG: Gfo/Idh/MocA family oxidoreductase [Chloroflexi bacterium]|nr:Gfo/Idh/MocA family oxidoreductase [Chloroflexota bacterium]
MTTEQASVRIGIIGCGGMAHYHIRELLGIPEVEIAALSDVSEASIGRTRERFRALRAVPAYDNHRAMLAQERLDGVLIATPHNLHYEPASHALEAGCNVLVEKPFVPTPAEARELVDQAARAGRLLAVGYQRRGMGAYRYMRQAIASGRLGQIHFANALLSQNWLRGTKGTWRQDPTMSCGGELNDSGSHIVNVLLFLIDDRPVEVYARTDNLGAPVDINSGLIVRFRNGVTATFDMIGHAAYWHEQVQVWGDQGTVTYQDGRVTERVLGSPHVAEMVTLEPNVAVVRNFVDAILGRAELYSPAATVIDCIELTAAAFRSAALNAPVQLAEAPAPAGA